MNIRESEERSIRLVLTAVLAFYIMTTVLAIAFLKLSGNLHTMADTTLDDSENVMEEIEGRVEGFKDDREEKEGSVRWDRNDTAEKAQELQKIVIDEPEEVRAEPALESSEEIMEEPMQEEPEPEKEYYSFVSTNVENGLNMRIEPDINSESIYKLPPGSKGLVIELGDTWSKVSAQGYTGYCDNEYLSMRQITKEEYLKQIDEMEFAGEEASSGQEEVPSAETESAEDVTQ